MPQLARLNCAVNFTCVAVAFPPPTYGWTTPIMNGNFNGSTIFWEPEDVKPEYFGDYTCEASSNGTTTTSDTVYLSGRFIIVIYCSIANITSCRYTYG